MEYLEFLPRSERTGPAGYIKICSKIIALNMRGMIFAAYYHGAAQYL
jgi:hypothetical protein